MSNLEALWADEVGLEDHVTIWVCAVYARELQHVWALFMCLMMPGVKLRFSRSVYWPHEINALSSTSCTSPKIPNPYRAGNNKVSYKGGFPPYYLKYINPCFIL
jgi:hypothetical protein